MENRNPENNITMLISKLNDTSFHRNNTVIKLFLRQLITTKVNLHTKQRYAHTRKLYN